MQVLYKNSLKVTEDIKESKKEKDHFKIQLESANIL